MATTLLTENLDFSYLVESRTFLEEVVSNFNDSFNNEQWYLCSIKELKNQPNMKSVLKASWNVNSLGNYDEYVILPKHVIKNSNKYIYLPVISLQPFTKNEINPPIDKPKSYNIWSATDAFNFNSIIKHRETSENVPTSATPFILNDHGSINNVMGTPKLTTDGSYSNISEKNLLYSPQYFSESMKNGGLYSDICKKNFRSSSQYFSEPINNDYSCSNTCKKDVLYSPQNFFDPKNNGKKPFTFIYFINFMVLDYLSFISNCKKNVLYALQHFCESIDNVFNTTHIRNPALFQEYPKNSTPIGNRNQSFSSWMSNINDNVFAAAENLSTTSLRDETNTLWCSDNNPAPTFDSAFYSFGDESCCFPNNRKVNLNNEQGAEEVEFASTKKELCVSKPTMLSTQYEDSLPHTSSSVHINNIKKPYRKQGCKFCKKNQEPFSVYTNHVLRDSSGTIVCPFLQNYVCRLCGATGQNAHTPKYCPQNTYDFINKLELE
ncbi:hypothetical protein FQR65_LT04240 [Abscondita terminalis]|nr:hypothetical protein FQR65_LT04240 [Abscondita terminalis]